MLIKHSKSKGFSLVELLLVLAILGIIAGIAIPRMMNQRRRAREIGDAQSNAKQLQMMLETRRADQGRYGTANATYSWTAAGSFTGSSNIAPAFKPQGNSQMDYELTVGATGLTYTLTVKQGSLEYFKTDQTMAKLN